MQKEIPLPTIQTAGGFFECWTLDLLGEYKQEIQQNLRKTKLTLRAVLYGTLGVAGGAELVHQASDVLHTSVHHGLHVVHVEQVELLQTTLQRRDLAPGVAQAGRHPIELHLRKGQSGSEEHCFGTSYKSRWIIEAPANLNFFNGNHVCVMIGRVCQHNFENPQAYQAGRIYPLLASV